MEDDAIPPYDSDIPFDDGADHGSMGHDAMGLMDHDNMGHHGPELRSPPHNYEVEQALLGAVLANNKAFERISDFLLPAHFADPAHAEIFQACKTLIERGQLANATTLKNYFSGSGSLEELGGTSYLAELQSSVVTIINASEYGKIIHDLYIRRELINLGEEVVINAHTHDLDLSATQQIEGAEQKLYRLAEAGQTEGGFVSFGDALATSINYINVAMKQGDGLAGISSGLRDVDKLLGGFHHSDLIILAARPSMGKTAFVTNIAFNIAQATKPGHNADGEETEIPMSVAFFSLEMSADQLASRILSSAAEMPSHLMRRGELDNDQFEHVFQVSRALSNYKLFIDDTPNLTVPGLRNRVRRLKRQHGLDIIIVDYLQLMSGAPGGNSDSRVQEVSEISRGLKGIAKEMNVPVIALSQLSRQTEQREDKRPQLSDLRESGSIEQDADVVLFLYRDEYYIAREKPGQGAEDSTDRFHEKLANHEARLEAARNKAEMIIGKQRHGPIGTVELHFNGEFTKFSDLAPDDHLPEHH
ncbi:replicative DNA helicase [Kiloniella laminariae]|uniref:Replicative DNA helicase n=1 Tax=Kiloniella laminariae TaxID=454162 RepID=A0ABT4LH29_9PROT|nr:replicative DNA helicase [Kiloniella laminariae]MCZ4280406.1 replicative DNA helicase [Kiloniella laminariae]